MQYRCWRRKVGCVTLVMACGLMGMWMRSRTIEDIVAVTSPARPAHVLSVCDGRLAWNRFDDLHSDGHTDWMSRKIGWDATSIVMRAASPRWSFKGDCWSVPLDHLVYVLTLMSAYLILWKSQKRKTSDPLTNPNLISN